MDADSIYAKGENLRGHFSQYYEEVETARRYYDLDFESEVVPPQWQNKLKPLIPPTARWAIDEAVDHILFTPRIKVQRRPSTSDKSLLEQHSAEKKRKFLAAWWHYVNQNMHILGDARKTLLNEGKVAIRKTLKWHLIPDAPPAGPAYRKARAEYRQQISELGRYEFLWELEILDNLSVAEAPDNHREPPYTFVKYEIYREVAKRMFPKDMPTPEMATSGIYHETGEAPSSPRGRWRDGDDLDKVEYCEYWSADSHDSDGELIPGRWLQFINSELVHDEENPYGYVPIAIEDAGFGTVRAGSAIHEKFVGMTQYMRPVFRAEATQMTSWEKVAEMTAFGLWIARNRDESKGVNIGPGEIVYLEGDDGQPGAETLEAVKLPEIPAGVLQLVEKTTQIANDSLKMRTLGGQPLSGVETATEADQQIRNASAKLGNPVAALERLAARLSKWVLMDIENCVEAPVTVYSAMTSSDDNEEITLGPKDINGYYEVSAELRTTDQEAVNMVKARFWGEMYRLFPFISAFTAMERGEITDEPQKEMLRRGAEDIYLSPQMQTIRMLTAAQSFSDFFELIKAQAFSDVQPGAGPAGPAGPEAGLPGLGGGGGFASQPTSGLGEIPAGANVSVPAAQPGGAGAARDILQGASQIRG